MLTITYLVVKCKQCSSFVILCNNRVYYRLSPLSVRFYRQSDATRLRYLCFYSMHTRATFRFVYCLIVTGVKDESTSKFQSEVSVRLKMYFAITREFHALSSTFGNDGKECSHLNACSRNALHLLFAKYST